MGEWSEFFEDFPEENPANWVDGVFVGPNGAQLHGLHQVKVAEARRQVASDQARLDSTVAKLIAAGKERELAKKKGG